MFNKVTRRLPVRSFARRTLINQPFYVEQGENAAPGFLNPPTPQERQFGDNLRQALQARGVDVHNLDLKQHQIRVENYEFDVPALPAEESPLWGYLWGNQLVSHQVLLDNLTEDEDYLREFLQQRTEELKRKMKIHYRQLDWESKRQKLNNQLRGQGSVFDRAYTEARVQGTADFIEQDCEGFSNLFRNNSYIDCFPADDEFGYRVPVPTQQKIEGLAKYDFDRHSSTANVDLQPYVDLLSQLSTFVAPKLEAVDPKFNNTVANWVRGKMSGSDAQLREAVNFIQNSSASLVGNVPGGLDQRITTVLSCLKADGAVKPKDAEAVVAAFRGRSSASEAASIKGKTDADLVAHFKDADEDRVDLLVQAANASKALAGVDSSQFVLSALFNGLPECFTQFAVDGGNVQKFVSSNGGALDRVAQTVNDQRNANAELAKGLTAVTGEVEQWLTSNLTLDKQALAAVSEQLPTILQNAGQCGPEWYVTALDEAVNSCTGLDRMQALILRRFVSSESFNSLSGVELYNTVVNPSVGRFSAQGLRGVAAALENGSFGERFSEGLTEFLNNSGNVTPTQAATVGKVGTLGGLRELAKVAKTASQAHNAADNAFKSVQWNVESSSIPALSMAYQGLSHPSFENVNAV